MPPQMELITAQLHVHFRPKRVSCRYKNTKACMQGSVSVLECVVGVLITQARGTGVCVCVHVLCVCVQFFSLASHKPYSLFHVILQGVKKAICNFTVAVIHFQPDTHNHDQLTHMTL